MIRCSITGSGLPADVKDQLTSTRGKPLLDERTFHQLLAAAYTLQGLNDRLLSVQTPAGLARPLHAPLPSERLFPVARSEVEPLAPPTSFGGLSETDCPPFSLAFEPSMRREAPPDPECPVRSESLVLKRLIPLAGPRGPNGTNNLWYARRPNFWRSVEAFVIAVVFACLLVRASMDRLSRLYRGPTLPSEMVEQRTPSQKPNQVAAVLPFSGPFSEKAIAKLGRLESTQRSQADITAEDTVIRYDQQSADRFQGKTTASLTRASGPVRLTFGRDTDTVAADTVVRYGTAFTAPHMSAGKKALQTIPDSLRSALR